MDAGESSEAAAILEEAYERFLDAYQWLEIDGELNDPVMEKKFKRVDKCLKELILYVTENTRGIWHLAYPPPTSSKLQ